MISNLSLGAASLAAAVLINYLITWYSNSTLADRMVLAQTVAFATWLVGHIFLAMTMRSERSPIWKQGIFSNRVMLVWAAAAIAFLIVVTNVVPLQQALHVTSLSGRDWGLVLGVPFVAVFWQEVRKLFLRR